MVVVAEVPFCGARVFPVDFDSNLAISILCHGSRVYVSQHEQIFLFCFLVGIRVYRGLKRGTHNCRNYHGIL